MSDNREIEETLRDIRAAKADLGGRRDQVVAEYADRLAALDRLAADLQGGQVTAKQAQAQVRKLIAGEKPKALLPRAAGRTTLGMAVPTANPTQAPPPTAAPRASGPTAARTQALVQKMLGQIDTRVMAILAASKVAEGEALQEAGLELSLLLTMRRSLEAHARLDDLPADVILLSSVVEYADHAQAALADLEAGGPERVRRFLEHNRVLASELVVLGAAVGEVKDQLNAARKLLGSGDANLEGLLKQALHAFGTLQRELEKRFPLQARTLLDEVLSHTVA